MGFVQPSSLVTDKQIIFLDFCAFFFVEKILNLTEGALGVFLALEVYLLGVVGGVKDGPWVGFLGRVGATKKD